VANEKNLRRGNPKTEFSGRIAVEAQKKSAESRKKNTAMRKAMKDIMAKAPSEVLSANQINDLRMEGIDIDNKTLMDVSVASIALQAIKGNVAAVKVIMELLGEDNAAEQRKIERERLALEREKMERFQDADTETERVQIVISPTGGIEVRNGESDG
jgi:hypothetical protein